MPVFFLPGWAFCGPPLALLPLPADWIRPPVGMTAGELAGWLAAACPSDQAREEPCVCVAWSLGALAAVEFCLRHPGRLAGLVLVGARRRWPAATLKEIDGRFAAQPRAFLEDFYRKCLLGHRHAWRRFSQALPSHFPDRRTVEVLRQDLALLSRSEELFLSWSERTWGDQAPRLLCVHGGRDVIAPVGEMALLPGAERLILPAEGHAAFLAGEAQERIAALAGA